MALIRNILLDDLIRHVAATTTKVATCPEMATPKLLAQMQKFLEQFVRRCSFDALHQAADRDLRWKRDEPMHMVFGPMAFDDNHVIVVTDFANQLTHPLTRHPTQRGASIFGHPHEVQVDVENGVRAAPIGITHGDSLHVGAAGVLKPAPKDEGFDPPRGRQ